MTTTTLDHAVVTDGGPSTTTKRVLLLKPRGFCAGVVRAIDIVRIALETFGAPIYVRKEIVHNSYVVNDLAKKGAIFVNELDEVPEGEVWVHCGAGYRASIAASFIAATGRRVVAVDDEFERAASTGLPMHA